MRMRQVISTKTNYQIFTSVVIFGLLTVIWRILIQTSAMVNVNAQEIPNQAFKTSRHPLTPLDPIEIEATATLIRQLYPEMLIIFASISLLEPPKALLSLYLNRIAGLERPSLGPASIEESDEGSSSPVYSNYEHSIPRKAFSVIVDDNTGHAYEVITNLSNISAPEEESFRKLKAGLQPKVTDFEEELAIKIVKSDQEIVKRLNKAGIENIDLVNPRSWIMQYFNDPELRQKRLAQMYMYFREFPEDNDLAHPLNFVPVVDLIERKVIRIEELPLYSNFSFSSASSNPIQLPHTTSNFEPKLLSPDFYRRDVHPIYIRSINGPSFTITDEYEVDWQKFQLRIGINYREGLVLHDIRYNDNGTVRPLLYRASIVEMAVPYGDPRPPFTDKRAFDFGDYGAGFHANKLIAGIDCLPDGHLISTYFNNHKGEAVMAPDIICVQEEDGGILHKHTSAKDNITLTRAVVLSIHLFMTIGNYDYGVYWKFHQDASISFEAKLTGLMSTNLVAPEVHNSFPWGNIVAPQIMAQYHQHLFSARLDTMFDGENNTVATVDIIPILTDEEAKNEHFDKADPFGQGFILNETVLKSESEAKTDTCLETDRTWKIFNVNSINAITNEPIAWKLVPMNKRLLLAKQKSINWKVAHFASHAVWVTKYHDDEVYSAGFYVNQLIERGSNGEGLPKYVENNQSIENEDIVLWHTFGTTHIPRIEDYPIMAAETVGFSLRPNNFFSAYPGLDVPAHQPQSQGDVPKPTTELSLPVT